MYGDYELIGEIAARPDITVHRARRRGRDYVIKVYRPPPSSPEAAPAHPSQKSHGEDPKVQFLNAVKLQKEVIKAGSRRFAPIYDAGYTPQGEAWYATAYYPRGSLKRWVASGMGVDENGLRWVVVNILRGLMDLKRATGRSHGNLKLTNVMMGGSVGTLLEETPIFLTDALADLKNWAGSLEVKDLRGLGELIFQLVMRREVKGAEDIPYPIAPSAEWNQLREKKDYWLQLCNRLLDPDLTLHTINLQRLAAEFGAINRHPGLSKVWLLLLLALLGGVGFWFFGRNKGLEAVIFPPTPSPRTNDLVQVRALQDPQSMDREFNLYVGLGQQAEEAGNYKDALKHYTSALQWRTNDPMCRSKIAELRPKARAQQQTAEMFNVALIIARAAEQAGSFTNALERYEWALNFDPNSAEVKEKIRELEPKAQAQRLATTNLAQALREAQAAEKSGDYIVASALYQALEQLSPDQAMTKQKIQELAPKADKQRKEVAKLMTAWQETTNLIAQADQLILQRKYSEAADELDRATAKSRITLEIDPSPDLKELHNALVKKAEGVREFDRVMRLGQKAFEQQAYEEARQHFTRALELIPDEQNAISMIEKINSILETKQQ